MREKFKSQIQKMCIVNNLKPNDMPKLYRRYQFAGICVKLYYKYYQYSNLELSNMENAINLLSEEKQLSIQNLDEMFLAWVESEELTGKEHNDRLNVTYTYRRLKELLENLPAWPNVGEN